MIPPASASRARFVAFAATAATVAILLVAVLASSVEVASAGDDPSESSTTTTEPETTTTVEPTTTSPPVTDPPPTTPPETTAPPTSAAAPTTPATTEAPRSPTSPTTAARRATVPTARGGAAPTTAPGAPPASDVAGEEAPVELAVEPAPDASVPTTTRERLPLLVAPSTVPSGGAVAAVIDSAPVSASRLVPLVIIAVLGLAGLVLALRPNGRRNPAADGLLVSPVALAGPSPSTRSGSSVGGATRPPPSSNVAGPVIVAAATRDDRDVPADQDPADHDRDDLDLTAPASSEPMPLDWGIPASAPSTWAVAAQGARPLDPATLPVPAAVRPEDPIASSSGDEEANHRPDPGATGADRAGPDDDGGPVLDWGSPLATSPDFEVGDVATLTSRPKGEVPDVATLVAQARRRRRGTPGSS